MNRRARAEDNPLYWDVALAHERELGKLEQLLATPIGRAELLLGKILPYIAVGLLNVILIPALAIAWFHIAFNGNFLLFFGLSWGLVKLCERL